jgi:hypothetical protein
MPRVPGRLRWIHHVARRDVARCAGERPPGLPPTPRNSLRRQLLTTRRRTRWNGGNDGTRWRLAARASPHTSRAGRSRTRGQRAMATPAARSWHRATSQIMRRPLASPWREPIIGRQRLPVRRCPMRVRRARRAPRPRVARRGGTLARAPGRKQRLGEASEPPIAHERSRAAPLTKRSTGTRALGRGSSRSRSTVRRSCSRPSRSECSGGARRSRAVAELRWSSPSESTA